MKNLSFEKTIVKQKKEGIMKTIVLKAVVLCLVGIFASLGYASAGVNIDVIGNDLTNAITVVVTNDTNETLNNRIGITAYCEEYTIDSVTEKNVYHDIQYYEDGFVSGYTVEHSTDGSLLESTIISDMVYDNEFQPGGMAISQVLPNSLAVLRTFTKPEIASNRKIYDIEVSDLETNEVLGRVGEYAQQDTSTTTSHENTNLVSQVSSILVSSTFSPDYSCWNVKDGLINRWDEGEWATNGEGAGAWIRLNWDNPQDMSEIKLYDRPNKFDQILDAYLQIIHNNGSISEIHLGEFASGGEPKNIHLTEAEGKDVIALKVYITEVSVTTYNAGLSEIECFNN